MDAKPGEAGKPLYYREEIFHPAIVQPVVTRGWFEISNDGSLIRHQTEPDAETSRIGEQFIFVTRDDTGERNIFPIPDEIAPLLAVLRRIVGQSSNLILQDYMPVLEVNQTGWLVKMSFGPPERQRDSLILDGCGKILKNVELQFGSNQRRRIIFEHKK